MERNVTLQRSGLSTLLTVAFIVLKLCGVINWAWVWVLAPFWIPLAITIVMLVIIAVAKGLMSLFD